MTQTLTIRGTALAVLLLFAGANHAAETQQSSSTTSSKPKLATTQVDETKTMDALLRAAQKLRESIQALAQQPAGPKRTQAMEAARDALVTTQRAMLDLPPETRVESVKKIEAKDWPKAAARLKEASETLNDALQTLSKQSAGKGRADAMAKARQALEKTQQAMLALPDYNPS